MDLHSIDSERSVIGAILLNNEAWYRVAGFLAADQFYHPAHQRIMRTAIRMLDAQQVVDVITLADALRAEGVEEVVGGLAYLADIQQNTPSAAAITAYATIVAKRAQARNAVAVAEQLLEDIRESDSPADVICNTAAALDSLTEESAREDDTLSAAEIARATLADIDHRYCSDPAEIHGITTGVRELDDRLQGIQGGDLVIIAGRPGMGKTTVAMNFGEHIAQKHGPVAVFSMEMSKKQLGERQMASLSGVSLETIKTGRIADDDWDKLSYAASILADLPMYVDFRPALTVPQIRAKSRSLARKHGKLAGIVVDYLQLITETGRNENRNVAVGKMTGALKALAKEMDCPLFLLSQLTRECEKRTNKRPIQSDLRESGSIEQDADIIIFPYRDEVYNPDTPDVGVIELIVDKFRQGQPGTARAAWIGECSRVRDLAPGYRPNPPARKTVTSFAEEGFD